MKIWEENEDRNRQLQNCALRARVGDNVKNGEHPEDGLNLVVKS